MKKKVLVLLALIFFVGIGLYSLKQNTAVINNGKLVFVKVISKDDCFNALSDQNIYFTFVYKGKEYSEVLKKAYCDSVVVGNTIALLHNDRIEDKFLFVSENNSDVKIGLIIFLCIMVLTFISIIWFRQ